MGRMPPDVSRSDAIRAAIRNVPDFPQTGIQFKDITPVLADPQLFAFSVDALISGLSPGNIDAVVGIDARGFIFASAVALRLKAGFVPIRKQGKLPWKTLEQSYQLEYGSNTVAIHADAFRPGSRVLLVDDLLATGGTAGAAAALVAQAGGHVLRAAFLIELTFLNGRRCLHGFPVMSVVSY